MQLLRPPDGRVQDATVSGQDPVPIDDSPGLLSHPVTLSFRDPGAEGEYLAEVARSRWPVLLFIFCFDVACYLFRIAAKCVQLVLEEEPGGGLLRRGCDLVREFAPQLANMAVLYLFLGLLNRRSRRLGDKAARQEEWLLSVCMAFAICNLLAALSPDNASDYVYVAFFLIATSSFLKIRWWVGMYVLAVPSALMQYQYLSMAGGLARAGGGGGGGGTLAATAAELPVADSMAPASEAGGAAAACAAAGGRELVGPGGMVGMGLPKDAAVHVAVAWAVGGLMAYLAEWYRRQMFAHAKRAALAHSSELMEAQARIAAQRALAAAQAQAAQRALSVAREKAANEAKSEFMSLMCHEVRTPLNGCLASAEMLLETPLQAEQRELAATIRVSGSILLSTVSNFLDFFKLEAGKSLDIVRTLTDLRQLVADVHCIIEAMIGRQGEVALKEPSMAGVPTHMVCDADRVRGILLNLYTNAAKFTKQGHIQLRVREVPAAYAPEPSPGYSAIVVAPGPGSGPGQPAAAAQQQQQHGSPGRVSAGDVATSLLLSDGSTGAEAGGATAWWALQGGQQQEQQPGWLGLAPPGSGSGSGCGSGCATPTANGTALTDHVAAAGGSVGGGWVHATVPWVAANGGPSAPGSDSAKPLRITDPLNKHGSLLTTNGQACEVSCMLPESSHVSGLAAIDSGSRCPDPWPAGPPTRAGGTAVPAPTCDLPASRELQPPSPSSPAFNCPRSREPGAGEGAARDRQGAPGTGWPGGGEAHAGAAGSSGGQAAGGKLADRWLLFEVADTGVGITPDGLKTLFRQYVQGTDDEMRKPRSKGGTGLGLSICSKQVGVLGGRIGAYSCPGRGSVFWFTVPLITAEDAGQGQGRGQGQAEAAGQQSAGQCRDGRHFAAALSPSLGTADKGSGHTSSSFGVAPANGPSSGSNRAERTSAVGGGGQGGGGQGGGGQGGGGQGGCPGGLGASGAEAPSGVADARTHAGWHPQGGTAGAALLPGTRPCGADRPDAAAAQGRCLPVLRPCPDALAGSSTPQPPTQSPFVAPSSGQSSASPHAMAAAAARALRSPPEQPGHEDGMPRGPGPGSASRYASPHTGASPGSVTPTTGGGLSGDGSEALHGLAPLVGELGNLEAAGEGPACAPGALLGAGLCAASRVACSAASVSVSGWHSTASSGLTDSSTQGGVAAGSSAHGGPLQRPSCAAGAGSGHGPGHAAGVLLQQWEQLRPGEGVSGRLSPLESSALLAAVGMGGLSTGADQPPGGELATMADDWAAGPVTCRLASRFNAGDLSAPPALNGCRVTGMAGGGGVVGGRPGGGMAPLNATGSHQQHHHVRVSHGSTVSGDATVCPAPSPVSSVSGGTLSGSVGNAQPGAGLMHLVGHGAAAAGSTGGSVGARPLQGSSRDLRSSALAGRRVLLVEDNLINQTVARKMLHSLGLQCEVASNGLEAVQAVERAMRAAEGGAAGGADAAAAAAVTPGPPPAGRDAGPPVCERVCAGGGAAEAQSGAAAEAGGGGSNARPAAALAAGRPLPLAFDAVLMDMMMPVMGGVDATRAIRRLGCRVPILAMTANASDRDRDECRAAGMDGFLSKPVLKDRLAESLLKVLEGSGWGS